MTGRRSSRPNALERKRRAVLAAVTTGLLAAAGFSDAPQAQIDYSPRIRSLSTSFAGIVDDPFTDAYLNPARVGDMGRGMYAGRLPGRSVFLVYPRGSNLRMWDINIFPPEEYPVTSGAPLPYSYTPYTLGLVTPVGGNTKMSLACEVAVTGSNTLEDDGYYYLGNFPSASDFNLNDDVDAYENTLHHGIVDFAFGTGGPDSPGRRFGIRGTVQYDRLAYGSVNSRQYIRGYGNAGVDLTMRYDYDRDNHEYERISGELSAGLFSGGRFLSQAVVGGGGGRETLNRASYNRHEDDDDYDGDGGGAGGGLPDYFLRRSGFISGRSYDSVRLYGRLGLRWGARTRSFHRVSWFESSGDGTGDYTNRELEIDGSIMAERDHNIDLGFDGKITGYRFTNAVGFVEQLFDQVMFAAGVLATIQRDESEEYGSGHGEMTAQEAGSVTQLDAPYAQDTTYDRDIWLLSVPLSFDWVINDYVAWRFGVDFRATRVAYEATITRDFDFVAVPGLDLLPVQDFRSVITYGTSAYFSSGLSLTFRDRLGLELLAGPTTGGLNAVYFSSALLSFRF